MLTFLALIVVVLLLGGWWTRPAKLDSDVAPFPLQDDLQAQLAGSEAIVHERFGITPGAEKRIRWAAAPGQRTERAIVYLHGFSATRQEIAPVPELVAGALAANLFETRLTGHGREREQMAGLTAEDLMRDGSEALAIGRALGERITLICVSTGATLAMALARHPDFARVDSLVFLSPNFAPAAAGSELLTGPFGPQIIRATVGSHTSWEPANKGQAMYWSTRYPTTAVVEMMRLVDLGWKLKDEARVDAAMLIYSPDDDVISVPKLREGFDALPAGRKETLVLEKPDSLSAHVVTGDILAPAETAGTAAAITAFLQTQIRP